MSPVPVQLAVHSVISTTTAVYDEAESDKHIHGNTTTANAVAQLSYDLDHCRRRSGALVIPTVLQVVVVVVVVGCGRV